MFQLTVWSIPAAVAAAIAAVGFVRLKHSPHLPGVVAMRWLFVGVAVWSGAQLAGYVSTNLSAKIWAAKLQYPGIVVAPMAWLVFAVTYAHRLHRPPPMLVASLLVVPVITVGMVFTNELHHLIWEEMALTYHEGVAMLAIEHGTWFDLHAYYSHAVVFAATVILGFSLSQSRLHLRPLIAVIVAPATVVLFNLSYIGQWTAIPWFDLTPISLAIATVILDTGVVRCGLLDTIPVMRHRIVEKLQDAVIVVRDKRIVDANPAALDLLDLDLAQATSSPVEEIIANKTLVELMMGRLATAVITLETSSQHLPQDRRRTDVTQSKRNEDDTHVRRRGDEDRTKRYYDVRATPVEDGDEITLVTRDITDRHRAEQALNNAKQDLERLANTDPLTGLHNRRVFLSRLSEEAERVRRHDNALSVLIFDLDHFKQINDKHGHGVGDLVLKEVSKVAQGAKRITDVSARIGGEEFAMLLPETDKSGAVMLAQRLRRSIESIRISDSHGAPIKVTASVGVATITTTPDDLDTILRFADRALYRAKNSGRNMVCIDDP